MAEQTFRVRILTPQQLILDTKALSVSSKNQKGPFDILPQHANFLTVVEKQPIIIRIKGQKPLKFDFPIAIIFAIENKVNIYTYLPSLVP